MRVNLVAPFELAREARAGDASLGDGGAIVNIASIWGLVGVGQIPEAGYAASKGGLVNLTRELAAQWARTGVRVNCLAPGWFRSEMTEGKMFDDEHGERWMRQRTPMGRGGDEHELDGALLVPRERREQLHDRPSGLRRRRLDRHLSTRAFVLALLAIVAIGVGIRLSYVHAVVEGEPLGADSTWYYLQAGSIRDGHGFVDPASLLQDGKEVATAAHPPGYPALLAVEFAFGARSITRFEQLGVLTGAGVIALTALLGLAIAGPEVALIAAAIVALDPMLIAADGSLMSESLYVLLVLVALLLAVRAMRSRAWGWWLALGLALGAAILTRQDATVLAVVLVGPLAWMAAGSWKDRLLKLVVAMAGTAIVVMPWVVRNAVQMNDMTITTSSQATALAGANCDATYYGPLIGLWSYPCTHEDRRATESETEWSNQLRHDATHYVRTHLARTPLVATARLGRGLGVFDPGRQATYEANETRSRKWQLGTFAASLFLLVVGAWGLLRHSPDRMTRWILAAPVITGLLVIVLSSPVTRLRALGEPSLAIGVGLLVAAWLRARRRAAARANVTADVAV